LDTGLFFDIYFYAGLTGKNLPALGLQMKKKSILVFYFSLILLLFVTGCEKQRHATKNYTIGVVNLNKHLEKVYNGFKEGLAKRGYIEGRNITYIYNGPRMNTKDIENDLAAMVDQHVDLIFSITTPATKKAKKIAGKAEIPVVFAPGFDPVKSGIVKSLVNPGKGVTGIKVGGNTGKALEWYLKVSPGTKTILVPFTKSNQATVQSMEELRIAAEKLQVNLIESEVTDKKGLTYLLEQTPPDIDGLWLLNSHFLVANISLYINAANELKLPLGTATSQADKGALVSYGQDAFRTGELAADLAHNILQGSPSRPQPVEATDYFLGINLKTAETLGINIPDHILQAADVIFRQ
jgi:putative ABC transport system substrate-binding protein